MNQVPEKLISFRVFHEGTDLLGVADIDLPDIEPLTDTVKGAGVAGEVESPVLGHFGKMSTKINWRTLVKSVAFLSQQRMHSLEYRGGVQTLNNSTGEYITVPIRIAIRGLPKKTGLGKLQIGSTTDSSNEFEVTYIKVTIDGQDVIEIDKYNYVCVIDGVDVLSDLRIALGLI